MRHPLLSLILTSLAGCGADEVADTGEPGWTDTACLRVAEDAACPAPEDVDVDELFIPGECGLDIRAVVSTETPTPETIGFSSGIGPGCCYDAIVYDPMPNVGCVPGRPYVDGGRALVAEGPPRDEARHGAAAEGWVEVARAEHASVAAFARLTLQLMAHGAPTSLLARVAAAMADEVRHAELAAQVARRLGAPVVFGAFPFSAAVEPRLPLARLAADAVREGCIGETLSALACRRAVELAEAPDVREALAAMADDEDRHAALSWAIVGWALRVGGPEVREAVIAAFGEPVRRGGQVATEDLAGLGLLGPERTREVDEAGLRDVIAPAAWALLKA